MRARQRRPGWVRKTRAFFLLPDSRRFLVVLAALGLSIALATVEFDLRYREPATGQGLDTVEAVYAALSLLFLNAPYALPADPLSRIIYFAVPFLGLVVAGQVLLRLGGAVVNRQRWAVAVASTYTNHVVVCGLGRVGFRVVRWLLDLGEQVVVVDLPVEDSLHDIVRGWGVPIVVGDGRRPEILREAGVQKASAIVPITDDDLLNLAIATEARAIQPQMRVVLRTFDDRLASNLQLGFDINRAYSTSALSAPAFAAAAVHAPVDYAFAFGEDHRKALVTITKFTVVEGSRLVGCSLAEVEQRYDVTVLGHRATTFQLNPPPERRLQVGEGFVVSASPDALDRLARATPPTRELRRHAEGRWPLDPTA